MTIEGRFEGLPSHPLVVSWSPLWNEMRRGVGLEHALVGRGTVDSVILCIDEDDETHRIEYELSWDEDWRTRQVTIRSRHAGREHRLHFAGDGTGNWLGTGGAALPQFRSCLDVDIWPTPFTNTLAIRRLRLAPGERKEIDAVWIDALTGEMKRERQAYSARDSDRYLFESLASGFEAELEVDRYGLVREYAGLFTRLR